MTKIATDIEQSKKLVEILPFESADMYWEYNHNIHTYNDIPRVVVINNWDDDYNKDIPCWSLAALLENIPVYLTKEDKTLRLQIDMGLDDFNIWYEESRLVVSELDCISEDFVDACVEMIVKLHKKGLL